MRGDTDGSVVGGGADVSVVGGGADVSVVGGSADVSVVGGGTDGSTGGSVVWEEDFDVGSVGAEGAVMLVETRMAGELTTAG